MTERNGGGAMRRTTLATGFILAACAAGGLRGDEPQPGAGQPTGVELPGAKRRVEEGERATGEIAQAQVKVEEAVAQAADAMSPEDFTRSVRTWTEEGRLTPEQGQAAIEYQVQRQARIAREQLMRDRVPSEMRQGGAWQQLQRLHDELSLDPDTGHLPTGTDEWLSETGRQGWDTSRWRNGEMTGADIRPDRHMQGEFVPAPAYSGPAGDGDPVSVGEWRARIEYFGWIERQAELQRGASSQAVAQFHAARDGLEGFAPQMSALEDSLRASEARLPILQQQAAAQDATVAATRAALQAREAEWQTAQREAESLRVRIETPMNDWQYTVPDSPSESDISAFQSRHPGARVDRSESPPDADGHYTITWSFTMLDGRTFDAWNADLAAAQSRAATAEWQVQTARTDLQTAEQTRQSTQWEIDRLQEEQRNYGTMLERLRADLAQAIGAVERTVADLWRRREEWDFIYRMARDAAQEIAGE